MNVKDGYMFEKYVVKIFEEAGYSVELEKMLEDSSSHIDIIAEKEAKRYCIEVKFSRIIDKAVERICSIAEEYNMLPVLVSAYVIEEKKKILYQKKYPKMIMIDVTNLLFAVKYRTELYNELVSILPYSVDDIELQEGFIKLDSIQHDDYTNSLIKEMEPYPDHRTHPPNNDSTSHVHDKRLFNFRLSNSLFSDFSMLIFFRRVIRISISFLLT